MSCQPLRDLIVSEHQRIRDLFNSNAIGDQDRVFIPLLAALQQDLAAEQKRLWSCDIAVAVSRPR